MKNEFESSIKRDSSSIGTNKVPSSALASLVMSFIDTNVKNVSPLKRSRSKILLS